MSAIRFGWDGSKVDRDRRIASVGGGTRIRELLTATLAAGLITPMGACGDVGVAGLALAGGDTAARGLHGTACCGFYGDQAIAAAYLAKWRAAFRSVEPQLSSPMPNLQGEVWASASRLRYGGWRSMARRCVRGLGAPMLTDSRRVRRNGFARCTG